MKYDFDVDFLHKNIDCLRIRYRK